MRYILKCSSCDEEYGPKNPIFRCNKCKSILEVSYAYPKSITLHKSKIKNSRYKQLFPLSGKFFTLGEGGTPLVKYEFAGVNLALKLETKNPTHSFKDRGSALEISKAKELGFKEVCCASTGNMGLSVATYSKKFGLKCRIFISKDAKPAKINKIKAQKAEIIELEGDFNKALETAELFARVNNAFLCGDYHYRKEGQKSIAYEILEQSKTSIDFIVLPVGNATLLAGIYKGLLEFKRFGLIKRLPRLVAVQAEGCNPLVRAFNVHKKIQYVSPNTGADAIAVGYPTFGFEGISALRKSKGMAIAVKDKEIADAVKTLHKSHIYAEEGGAAAFAGFLKLYKRSPSKLNNKNIICLVTGNN